MIGVVRVRVSAICLETHRLQWIRSTFCDLIFHVGVVEPIMNIIAYIFDQILVFRKTWLVADWSAISGLRIWKVFTPTTVFLHLRTSSRNLYRPNQ